MKEFSCTHSHAETKEIEDIIRDCPSEDKLSCLADFFKAFADPTRLKIIQALSHNELCVCCIADSTGMSQSAVSHQLRYLKNIDILKSRREGKSIIYSLKDSHILHIYGEGLIHINEEKEAYKNA